jgi:hypothetical protein
VHDVAFVELHDKAAASPASTVAGLNDIEIVGLGVEGAGGAGAVEPPVVLVLVLLPLPPPPQPAMAKLSAIRR